MDTLRDAPSVSISGQLEDRDQEERTVRPAGSESSKPSDSPMQASSVYLSTRQGWTAPWLSTPVQTADLLLQDEQPMENPGTYLEEVCVGGSSHADRATTARTLRD